TKMTRHKEAGVVVNHRSIPIIIVGTDPERTQILLPGESSQSINPPMGDVDFWRTFDGDPNIWYKIGDAATAEIVDNPSDRPTGVKQILTCHIPGICSSAKSEEVCAQASGPYGPCPNAWPQHSADGRSLPGIITSGRYYQDLVQSYKYQIAIGMLADIQRRWDDAYRG